MIQFRIGEPAGRALALADLKAHLHIDHDSEDSYLEGLIDAAAQEVELATGCALVTQAWRLTADTIPRFGTFELRVWPVRSVQAVTIYDRDGNAFALAADDWTLEAHARPAQVRVDAGKRRADAIEIDFLAGYGDESGSIPPLLRQAMLVLCARWYEYRATAGSEEMVAGYPASFERLIDKFRHRRV